MSSRSPLATDLVPAVVAIAFVAFALSFGMTEWKSDAPATASAPPTVTQQ